MPRFRRERPIQFPSRPPLTAGDLPGGQPYLPTGRIPLPQGQLVPGAEYLIRSITERYRPERDTIVFVDGPGDVSMTVYTSIVVIRCDNWEAAKALLTYYAFLRIPITLDSDHYVDTYSGKLPYDAGPYKLTIWPLGVAYSEWIPQAQLLQADPIGAPDLIIQGWDDALNSAQWPEPPETYGNTYH